MTLGEERVSSGALDVQELITGKGNDEMNGLARQLEML